MIRDPKYYLKRAEYFNKKAKENGYETDNLVDDINDTKSESEYEYIEIKPNSNIAIKPIKQTITNIKPMYKRYFDPVTRHYYRTEKIFNDIDNSSCNIEQNTPKKNPDIWYPQNKLSFKTMRDPISGKYYRINKIYDNNGDYYYKCDELKYNIQKKPGTNYYIPVYNRQQ